MAFVYRSVRVVVQNSTDDVLTVEGTEILLGAWTNGRGVKAGDRVPAQSAAVTATESTELGRGTQAFVRYGSVAGYTQISWYLPWVGGFQIRVEPPEHGRRAVNVQINDEDPANIAVLVELKPCP